jgi:hypothetical protein
MYDRSKLRDGFDINDNYQADIEILPSINSALRTMLTTGYIKCSFFKSVVAGTYEYTLPPGAGEVTYVHYKGLPLTPTSVGKLDRTLPGWQNNIRSGTPTLWYNAKSDVIGLYCAPYLTDSVGTYSLEIMAEALTDDLTAPESVPSRLPHQFHEDVAIGASCEILGALGDAASSARLAALMPRWDSPDETKPGAIQRLREFAQRKDTNAVQQITPTNYRTGRRWR